MATNFSVKIGLITVIRRPGISVGIDLKELGVRCRNVWNFARGL